MFRGRRAPHPSLATTSMASTKVAEAIEFRPPPVPFIHTSNEFAIREEGSIAGSDDMESYQPAFTPSPATTASTSTSTSTSRRFLFFHSTSPRDNVPSGASVVEDELNHSADPGPGKTNRKVSEVQQSSANAQSTQTIPTTGATTTTSTVFSFRKSSVAGAIRTLRRGSLAMIGRSHHNNSSQVSGGTSPTPSLGSQAGAIEENVHEAAQIGSPRDSPQRKKSSVTSMAARKAMRAGRQRFSAAKLALRKMSHSSLNRQPHSPNNSSPRTPGSGRSVGSGCSLGSSPKTHGTLFPLTTSVGAVWDENMPSRASDDSGRSVGHGRDNGYYDDSKQHENNSAIPSLIHKKPLAPSLSWDPEQRSRTPSTSSRYRVHSDGKADTTRPRPLGDSKVNNCSDSRIDHRKRRKPSQHSNNKFNQNMYDNDNGGYDRLELERSCLHCSLGAEHRRSQLRAEIENAVQRLSRRLGNRRPSSSWPRVDEHSLNAVVGITDNSGTSLASCEQLRRTMGTPDIVVSSFSSDEDSNNQRGLSAGAGLPSERPITPLTYIASALPDNIQKECSEQYFSDASSPGSGVASPLIFFPSDFHSDSIGTSPTTSPLFNTMNGFPPRAGDKPVSSIPNSFRSTTECDSPTSACWNDPYGSKTALHKPLQAMDTLKPPGYFLPPGVILTVEGGKQIIRQEVTSGGQASTTATTSNTIPSPPRSNSVDLSTLRRDIELWSVSSGDTSDPMASDNEGEPPTPAESVRTVRSRSHDPTQSPDHVLRRPSRIEHLSEIFRKALAKSPVVKRAAAMQEQQQQKRVCKHRTSRYWLEEQPPNEHIWLPSSGPGTSSRDTECYLGEKDCEKIGDKRRCAACHIVAHTACFPLLSKMNMMCKVTFRDCGSSTSHRHLTKESHDSLNAHHWLHRWKLEGRCQQCGKSFQQKRFRDKEIIAITCSWCKRSYHNKPPCFTSARFDEKCDRGALRDLILPPSWLLRLSSNRKRHAHKAGSSKANHRSSPIPSSPLKKLKRKYRPFVVKPMLDPSVVGPTQHLLVFVNPKSGGNKGSKALHTLCWLLNPRQVFDITTLKGPKYGLEMFRKIATQMRILVAGGDGTVGWVLSTLDSLNWPTYPPMALLPLGTGNDLSRCMGWGGVFSDEPLAELLGAILTETSITYLDRWRLDVQPNTSINPAMSDSNNDDGSLNEAVQSSLPLTVMNNYFSIGADAHVALQFHHSRSANPQVLNSRFKNRIAYGGLGTIDLFKRTWKDLSEFIVVECDDVDISAKIRDSKFHCVLFHNISFYAGGTVPWGGDCGDEGYARPSCCDQLIEVIGFTTATLAALQMGAKGERIAQCSKVRIQSTKAIPMQVDGEPCMLAPSIIKLSFHSKVPMLKRDKKVLCTANHNRRANGKGSRAGLDFASTSIFMHVPVIVVGRHDYDTYRDSIDRLKDTGFEIGVVSLEAEMELQQARYIIQKLLADHAMLPYEPGKEWRFLDYISNCEEGTFRISRHHEHSHSISDICNLDECIIILDDAFPSMTSRSAAIGHDLIFSPAKNSSQQSALTRRRISETLRIVLSSDSQETHL